MEKFEFTAILQVALWDYEGMSELEIRQLLATIINDRIIKAGLKLSKFLRATGYIKKEAEVQK